ncbi:MAG TPA: hypothetical protein PLK63_03310 [Catalimonadaceae bacterium]|nr:hypothetical protein [Catalimonadaceae bacterium]
MIRFIFILISSMVITACFQPEKYPITKEGQLLLSFEVEIDTFHFNRIEAERGNRPVPLGKPYRLPMNSASDSTCFFFHSGSRIDTLAVSYTRTFTFDVKESDGYKLYLDNVLIRKNTLSKNGYIQRSTFSSDSLVGQILLED